MVQRELRCCNLSARRCNALEDAKVRARYAEVQRQVIAIDCEVADLPFPVREAFHQRLELRGNFRGRPGLVVDVEGWCCVELLHRLKVVRVAVVNVGLVEQTALVIGSRLGKDRGRLLGCHGCLVAAGLGDCLATVRRRYTFGLSAGWL